MLHPSSSPRRGEAPPGGWTPLKPEGATLSERHAAYLAERGVAPEVAAAAGYWTARRPSEMPLAFSSGQRRRHPALIAPHQSPDGETVGWQKRDDHPGRDKKGELVKWVSPKAERAPTVLSVHPWMHEEVNEGTGPLWVVEGLTRCHALAGLGIPAVSYAGCYSWQKDGDPIACWEPVNLAGRLVYDVPDADARINANVQKAQARRVAYLESRGARVLVVSVPEVNGDEHAGLDDYIAAGGDPEELARAARPFVPVDVGRERLRKDERLRLAVARIRRGLEALETRKGRECSAGTLARYLVGEAERHGKTREGGIQVQQSHRQMAAGIRVALATIKAALEQLEEVNFLERLPADNRTPHEAASYVLLYPSGGGSEFSEHKEERRAVGEKRTETGGEGESSLSQRESFLSVHSTRGGMKSESAREKVPEVPALRNAKLVHEYARKDGRRVVVDSRYYPRYGKKRELIIRYVLELEGADETEIHEKFGSPSSRLRDFRRTWITPMLKDGVFVRDGGWILPAPDWTEALERVRERTDEEADNRRQDEKYAEQGRTFRQRLAGEKRGTVAKPERVPELAGPERMAEIVAEALDRDDAAAIEEQRRKVGETAEVFIYDRLRELGSIRMETLREVWADQGGNPSDIWRTAKRMGCRFRKLPEYDNALFVYPPVRSVVDLPSRTRRDVGPEGPGQLLRMPKPAKDPDPPDRSEDLTKPETESPLAEDWRSHPLACECPDCAAPVPTYARAWSGA
jgi:hypothetical protein